jgi:hypothetical protein
VLLLRLKSVQICHSRHTAHWHSGAVRGRRLPCRAANFLKISRTQGRQNARIHASGFQTLKAQHVESRLITIAALFEYCIDADTSLRKLSVFLR